MSDTGFTEDVMRQVLAERGLPLEDGHPSPLCERAIVGALLIDGGKRGVGRMLSKEDFGDKALGAIYDMLMSINGPIDLMIAVDVAERRGLDRITGKAGLATYLASLLDLVPDVENVEGYARRVKEAANARAVARELEQLRMARVRRIGV